MLDPPPARAISRAVRRIAIVLLLLASHAGVLWLGQHGRDAAGSSAHGAEKQPPEKTAATAREAESPGVTELLRRATTREKKTEEEDSDEAAAKRAAEVAAAKAKIPADADLAALVRAGTTDQEEVSAATVAAFGLWIDRDAVAALRWFGAWDPDYATWDFDEELTRHLKAGGLAMVDHYLKEVPMSRASLFFEIGRMEEERGPSFVLDVAAGLSDPEDRLEMLASTLYEPEKLEGNLAKIRALFNDREANAFVKQVGGYYPKLAEEFHSAGFPPELLAGLDQQYADEEEAPQKGIEAVEEKPPSSLAERIRAEENSWRISYDSEFKERVPDFSAWCAEMQDGSLSPQEMMARLQAAIPGGGGIDAQLRMMVLAQTFEANPRQGLEWLRSEGGDWREAFMDLVHSSRSGTPPELLESVVRDAYAGEAIPSDLVDEVASSYDQWALDDPEGYQEAVRRMPDGPVKQRLEAPRDGEEISE